MQNSTYCFSEYSAHCQLIQSRVYYCDYKQYSTVMWSACYCGLFVLLSAVLYMCVYVCEGGSQCRRFQPCLGVCHQSCSWTAKHCHLRSRRSQPRQSAGDVLCAINTYSLHCQCTQYVSSWTCWINTAHQIKYNGIIFEIHTLQCLL